MDLIRALPKLRCYCHHHCPHPPAPPPSILSTSTTTPPSFPVSQEGICEVDIGGRCFAAAQETYNPETGHLEPEYSYGCFRPGDPTFLQCKGHLVDHSIPQSILCCEGEDFCNEHLKPVYKPSNLSDAFGGGDTGLYEDGGGHSSVSDYFVLQLLLGVVFSLLLLTFLIVLYIVCKYKAKEKGAKYLNESSDSNKSFLLQTTHTASTSCPSTAGTASTSIGFLSVDSSGSGSGSGMPLLVQRTIGRQISLKQRIGKGRYGEVYLGEWRGTYVAVKSINSSEEGSWWREQTIYKLALMKHPNILESMAWDIRSSAKDALTQMIIVTDYHPKGSLYDFLQNHTLSEEQALRLVLSAASGLCHIHMEVEGKPYKPGIAHRDLKSKNILVKNNGEVCIADFGLAVCSVSGDRGVDSIPPNVKQGTKRYMPPEVLDDSLKVSWFEAYKQGDMYSFALCLWEVGRRTMTPVGDNVEEEGEEQKYYFEEYAVPFAGLVQGDPSFEEMKRVVCDEVQRPEVPERWAKSKFLREMTKMMKECWHRSPQVRLTSLRVKKTLTELRDKGGRRSPSSPTSPLFFGDSGAEGSSRFLLGGGSSGLNFSSNFASNSHSLQIV